MVRRPILYITHTITNKVRGTLENRRRNAIAFVRLFLMTLYRLAYINSHGEKVVKFGDILELIGRHSQFTLITIAVIPLALPIPYPPGMPSVLAIPVFIFIINALLGRKLIKMPQKVLNYSMKFDSIKRIVMQSKFVITILARISRGGRVKFLAEDQLQKVHLSFMFLMALAVVIPFPGTNYLPSLSIFVIAIGCVLTDGILVIIGYFIGLFGIFLLMLFVIFGKKIVLTFLHFVKNLPY